MKISRAILMFAIFPLIIGCTSSAPSTPNDAPPSNTQTPEMTSQENNSPAPEPSATLNAIQQALATQAADPENQVARTPRTSYSMPEDSLSVHSPDGNIEVQFGLLDGTPFYSISRGQQAVILPSRMGFTFLKDDPLSTGFRILSTDTSSVDTKWEQPWGEVRWVRDHHNELAITLVETEENPRELTIRFRAFNDGVGFRYEFPLQTNLTAFEIMDEHTEFAMAGDHEAWWIPAFQDNRYEYLYRQTPLSRLSRGTGNAAHTPFTMETDNGLWLSIHEVP